MNMVFSYKRLHKALDGARRQRKYAWNKVATRAGVSPTSLSMFARYYEERAAADTRRPKLSLENVVALLIWMDEMDLKKFLVPEDHPDATS